MKPTISRKAFLAGASALALTACSAPETQEEEKVFRFGAEMSYAPYNYSVPYYGRTCVPIENVDGQYAEGYDIFFAKKVADALDTRAVAVKLPWDELIPALQEGTIDAIIAGMDETPERLESVSFSGPYIEDSIGLMVMLGSPYVHSTSLADFSFARVMGQKGTLFDEVLTEIPNADIATPADSMDGVFEALLSGAVDAVSYPKMSESMYLKIHPEFVPIQFTEDEGFSIKNSASIAVKKGNEGLLKVVEEVVSSTSDAERQELWDRALKNSPQ